MLTSVSERSEPLSEGTDIYNLKGKVAVITGGGGALGSSIACGFARAGAECAVTNITLDKAEYVSGILAESCGHAKGYELDAMKEGTVEGLCDEIYKEFGKVDILVNCVGGNLKEATTTPDQTFFDLPLDAIRTVMDLNFLSTVVKPCPVSISG